MQARAIPRLARERIRRPAPDRLRRSGQEQAINLPAVRRGRDRNHRPGRGAQARDLKADRSSREDRGHGDAARTENRGAAEDRAARAEGRDPGTVSRPTQTTAGARSHDNAFAGAHDDEGGSFDRAASARGHASKDGGGARQQHASRGERRR